MSRTLDALDGCTAAEIRALAAYATSEAAVRPTLAGKVAAVLAFGPSALPPAAWIAAASRLGAGVVRAADLDAERLDEFEACARAARWADILVVSHPLNGFARAIGQATSRGVVNAGEPDGEDPAAGISLFAAANAPAAAAAETQPLRAAVCGDLARSRSARALLSALAAVEATVLLVPAQGRDLPEDDLDRLARRMRRRPFRFEARSMASLLDMVDTVLLAPETAPQLPLFQEVGVPPGDAEKRARRDVEDLDVLFVAGENGADRLVHEPFRGGRRTSLPPGAEHSTSVRALEAALLFAAGEIAAGPRPRPAPDTNYRSGLGLTCHAELCVAARRPDRVTPDFEFASRKPLALVCLHCGARTSARYAASKVEGRFHSASSAYASHILDTNLVLFESRPDALAAGFEPARRGRDDETSES